MNPLFAAIQDHEATLATIRGIVEANPSLVRPRNVHGYLRIHEAVAEVPRPTLQGTF